jgi:hypothetical protein
VGLDTALQIGSLRVTEPQSDLPVQSVAACSSKCVRLSFD